MKSPTRLVEGRIRRPCGMVVVLLLALAALTAPGAAQAPAGAEEPLLLRDYRDQLRRMLVLGQYQDLIELASDVQLQFPDEVSIDYYRTQAQLRLADDAMEYPFERLKRRPSSLPEPLQRIQIEPIFQNDEGGNESAQVIEIPGDRDVALEIPPPPQALDEEKSKSSKAPATAPGTPRGDTITTPGSNPVGILVGFIGLIIVMGSIIAVVRKRGQRKEFDPDSEPEAGPSAPIDEPRADNQPEFEVENSQAEAILGKETEGALEAFGQGEGEPEDLSLTEDPFAEIIGEAEPGETPPEVSEAQLETEIAPLEVEFDDSSPTDLESLGKESPDRSSATEGEVPAPLAEPPSPSFDTWGHEMDQSEGVLNLPTNSGESQSLSPEPESGVGDISSAEDSNTDEDDELIQIPELASEPPDPEPTHADPPSPSKSILGGQGESSVELSGNQGESDIDFAASEFDLGEDGEDESRYAEPEVKGQSQSGIDLPPTAQAGVPHPEINEPSSKPKPIDDPDLDETVGTPDIETPTIDADGIVQVIGNEDDETGEQPTKPSSFNQNFGEGEDAKPLGEIQEFREGDTIQVSLARVDPDETLKPGEKTDEEDQSRDITATAHPGVNADPFDKEKDLGLHAFDREEWDRAVHHLSIAAALRPDAQDVKERLRKARRERRTG